MARFLVIPVLSALLLAAAGFDARPASASPRWEYWEGRGEIARERRELRRDLMRARNPREARRAVRQGIREIARERREMRREVRREIRQRRWRW